MTRFANYDVRQWLVDGVLSAHPESPTRETETELRDGGTLSNLAYSVVLAASMAMLPGLTAGEVTHLHHSSMRSPNPTARGDGADKVYWFEAAPSPVATTGSVVDGFESYFNEIHAQLQAGGLLDVPTETREAARLALTRTAPDNWIEKLASDLGSLTD